MTLRGLTLVLLAIAPLTGCIIVDPGPGPGPGPAPSCIPAGLLTSDIALGVGAPDPGYDGIIITANVGGSYRITWDNSWMFTKISGYVRSSTCTAINFTPGCTDGSCRLMGTDRVAVGSITGEVAFEGYPGGFGRSGFDVVIGPGRQLMVDATVDGIRQTGRVVFVSAATGRLASAPALPFLLAAD